MERYLLFIEGKEYPSDHDLLVDDYVASFSTSSDAMDYYDRYRPRETKPQALVARYNGTSLTILYRTTGYSTQEHEFRPGWADKW